MGPRPGKEPTPTGLPTQRVVFGARSHRHPTIIGKKGFANICPLVLHRASIVSSHSKSVAIVIYFYDRTEKRKLWKGRIVGRHEFCMAATSSRLCCGRKRGRADGGRVCVLSRHARFVCRYLSFSFLCSVSHGPAEKHGVSSLQCSASSLSFAFLSHFHYNLPHCLFGTSIFAAFWLARCLLFLFRPLSIFTEIYHRHVSFFV